MLKMIRFYTEADQGEGTRGGGGAFFLCQTAAKRATIIFQVVASSYLRDWFSGTPLLLKDLNPPLLLPVFPILQRMYC